MSSTGHTWPTTFSHGRKMPLMCHKPSWPPQEATSESDCHKRALGIRFSRHLGPLSKTTTRNQLTVFITDRYTKLASAFRSSKSTTPQTAPMFFDHWVIPYRTPSFLLTESGSQFMEKCFKMLWTSYVGKHLETIM